MRLQDKDGRRDDDNVLHNLRESESDPLNIGANKDTNRRVSYLTRDRINSFSSRGGSGRQRSSSAIEFLRPFDSPEKMKDMFQLLLEDDAGAGSRAKLENVGDASNQGASDAEEVLFGVKGGDEEALKSNYDPGVVSLDGFDLNSKSGRKPYLSSPPSSSSSSSSLPAAQSEVMQRLWE